MKYPGQGGYFSRTELTGVLKDAMGGLTTDDTGDTDQEKRKSAQSAQSVVKKTMQRNVLACRK
jgi:hypothetical protein